MAQDKWCQLVARGRGVLIVQGATHLEQEAGRSADIVVGAQHLDSGRQDHVLAARDLFELAQGDVAARARVRNATRRSGIVSPFGALGALWTPFPYLA